MGPFRGRFGKRIEEVERPLTRIDLTSRIVDGDDDDDVVDGECPGVVPYFTLTHTHTHTGTSSLASRWCWRVVPGPGRGRHRRLAVEGGTVEVHIDIAQETVKDHHISPSWGHRREGAAGRGMVEREVDAAIGFHLFRFAPIFFSFLVVFLFFFLAAQLVPSVPFFFPSPSTSPFSPRRAAPLAEDFSLWFTNDFTSNLSPAAPPPPSHGRARPASQGPAQHRNPTTHQQPASLFPFSHARSVVAVSLCRVDFVVFHFVSFLFFSFFLAFPADTPETLATQPCRSRRTRWHSKELSAAFTKRFTSDLSGRRKRAVFSYLQTVVRLSVCFSFTDDI